MDRQSIDLSQILEVAKYTQPGAALFAALGLFAGNGDEFGFGAASVIAGFGIPFLILFLLRLFLPCREVNVFGRRSRARLRFWLRRRRAQEIFDDLSRKIRARQEAVATNAWAASIASEEGVPGD